MIQSSNQSSPVPTWPEGPRKVILGTSIFSVLPAKRSWQGVERRIEEIGQRLAAMNEDSRQRHGRGLDLAVFPENSLNSKEGKTLEERSEPLEGPIQEKVGAFAREHGTWIIVSFNQREDEVVYNVAVLFDRAGDVAGIYRKVFCVAYPGREVLEGGKQPGTEFPVFSTDFGTIGMQVCYDCGYDDGWEALGKQGAEIVAWPSMSPGTFLPRMHAWRFGYYVVSATPRNNASIFDPLGRVAAQVTTPEVPLTHEVDLDYRILPWQPKLDGGQSLKREFGDRVGFVYSEREDCGIFWSNDPAMPIGRMVESLGLEEESAYRRRNRDLREQILAR